MRALARPGSMTLMFAFLFVAARAVVAQEHDHSQHNHGDPGAPPKPTRTVEIGPGGIPLAEPSAVDVEVKIYDVHTQHLDRPLKLVEFEAPAIGRPRARGLLWRERRVSSNGTIHPRAQAAYRRRHAVARPSTSRIAERATS